MLELCGNGHCPLKTKCGRSTATYSENNDIGDVTRLKVKHFQFTRDAGGYSSCPDQLHMNKVRR